MNDSLSLRNLMKKIILKILNATGRMLSYVYCSHVSDAFSSMRNRLYTGYLQRRFKHLGDNSVVYWHPYTLSGLENVSVGNDTIIEPDVQLTALGSVSIGSGCLIRRGAHITSVESITIGDGLLTGTNVLITDNTHGTDNLGTPPRERTVAGRGPVTIGKNVWLGNNVCIMPGVTIGDGAVIGANSIVTHNIPDHAVAAGVPARVIKNSNK